MEQGSNTHASLAAAAEILAPALIAIRRDLHAHPEIAFNEHRTAGVVSRELDRLAIAHRTGVGGTGVVADLQGGLPGPTVILRADMDALPIEERTGLPFASTNPGLMHACGHDLHTATLLGAAALLRDFAPQLRGTVRLVFQPAEETLQGAAAMIADGVLEGVDMALGFHNQPGMPTDGFGAFIGATLAAADRLEITVGGKSGHAAAPHGAIDPIVAAASLVLQLQTIVSREISPQAAAVLSFGTIQGGTANNIIPDSCALTGTVRSLSASVRDQMEDAIRRVCAGMALASRTRIDVVYRRLVPPLMNDAALTPRVLRAIEAHFGRAATPCDPVMAAEDFALFAAQVPACQIRLGSAAPGRRDHLHNSDYQPDEASIAIGARALACSVLDLLS
jgi:amidohydrolase